MRVSPTAFTVAEGGSGSYTVALDARPSADVTVTVGGHTGSDVTLDEATLTFTPENWNTAQTVTVSAAHDDDAAPDEVILSHTVSGADEYASVTAASVTVTVTDDDTAGLEVAPPSLTVTEGDTADPGARQFTVSLATEPSATVVVAVDVAGGDSGVTTTPDSLTFPSATGRPRGR